MTQRFCSCHLSPIAVGQNSFYVFVLCDGALEITKDTRKYRSRLRAINPNFSSLKPSTCGQMHISVPFDKGFAKEIVAIEYDYQLGPTTNVCGFVADFERQVPYNFFVVRGCYLGHPCSLPAHPFPIRPCGEHVVKR